MGKIRIRVKVWNRWRGCEKIRAITFDLLNGFWFR